MRKYETIFILDPDVKDQARTDLFDRVKGIIARENGILLDFDEWGNKKLAYEIKKKLRGFYVCITYGGTGLLVKELERNLRLSDDVLKFMTLLLSDDVTVEQLEEEAKENQDKLSEKTDNESVETEIENKSVEKEIVDDDTLEDEKKVEETKEETE
ncbi:MAG: 30S ribosomal protein S6 [Thermodesulfobacteriota bacterium]